MSLMHARFRAEGKAEARKKNQWPTRSQSRTSMSHSMQKLEMCEGQPGCIEV